MLFKDSALLDRIFRVFDVDDDNEIIFSEYLSCMSMISSKATKEEKLKCKLVNRLSTVPLSFTLTLFFVSFSQFLSKSTISMAMVLSGSF